jgi:two-component system OmpR family response regulator
MRVLVIEDDRDAAGYMAKGLKESGHNVDVVHNGKEGLLLAAGADYDVLVVDRMLPELDGLNVVKTLRATGNQTPVLFVTALGEVDERVKGLRSGGDDYLAKPYAFSELLARLEAVGRRRAGAAAQSGGPETVLRYHDLVLDLLSRRVERGGRPIDLQPREFKLLEVLMRHAGQVMTRTMLLEKVWDYRFDPQTNVIDVHISRLRQKIDRGFAHPLIHTIRGAGYSLRAPDKAA